MDERHDKAHYWIPEVKVQMPEWASSTALARHEIALFCFSLKSTTGPQKQHENDRNCPFPSHLLV